MKNISFQVKTPCGAVRVNLKFENAIWWSLPPAKLVFLNNSWLSLQVCVMREWCHFVLIFSLMQMRTFYFKTYCLEMMDITLPTFTYGAYMGRKFFD